MKRIYRWALILLVLIVGYGTFLLASNQLTDNQIDILGTGGNNRNTIMLTHDGWSGTYLPMYVLKTLLEDRLGYSVQIYRANDIPDAFAAVSDGRSDIFTSGWFPIRDFTFSKHPNLVKLGTVYGGSARDAFEGIMVSHALAASGQVQHLQDLARAEIISALDSDGDGRGELLGCPSDWACATSLPALLQEYKLSQQYTIEVPASEKEMLKRLANRLTNNQPTLFYMLQPAALPSGIDLQQAVWLQGSEAFLPLSFNRTVVRGDLLAHYPEAAQLLATYRIPGEDISAAMAQIDQAGDHVSNLEQIAQDWIEDNEALVDGWLVGLATDTVYQGDQALPIAYSPEKENLFLQLAIAYNMTHSQQQTQPAPGDMLPIIPVRREMRTMFRSVVKQGVVKQDVAQQEFAAISPDSSIWLDQFDKAWLEHNPGEGSLISERHRYALSPIVIAMWADIAEQLGYPQQSIGWQTLIDHATTGEAFRWSHQSTHTASGLLATTALFYAGAGKSSDLAQEDILAQKTLDFVTTVESTVTSYGGESEDLVVTRLLAEGGRPLHAFVAQEQLVTFYNSEAGPEEEKLLAVYPQEGTLWMDHPLVLLDAPWVTEAQQRSFRSFANFLGAPAQQKMVLAHGYRPSDLGLTLDSPQSRIRPELGVNPEEPKRLLKVPPLGVLENIRELWRVTKKPANIHLVVDVSGSMEGAKLKATQGALLSFIAQVNQERESLGMIAFSTDTRTVEPLGRFTMERAQPFQNSINTLVAGGETHLYQAIATAHQELVDLDDRESINVIVAMTDGLSNDDLAIVENSIAKTDLPVLIFTVAYGEDADMGALQQVARLGNGIAYPSDPATIEQLYELLSAFF